MTEPGVDERRLLPRQVSDEIFRDQIVPRLLAAGEPQARPVVVVLSAQPGAGKTRITSAMKEDFADRGGAVAVDVDAFKPFYPDFRQLVGAHGSAAYDVTVPDARRWFEQALDNLAERQVNVVAEHGLRNQEVTDSLLNRFVAAEYRVEGALLATPAAVSRLGILERYQVGYEQLGFGRYVSEELHDQRYENLLHVADALDADPRVAAVSVYRRGDSEPMYRNERDAEGVWRVSRWTRDVVDAERNRPWTLRESSAYLRSHGSLAGRMSDEWSRPLEAARDAAAPLLHPDSGRGGLPPGARDESVADGRRGLLGETPESSTRSPSPAPVVQPEATSRADDAAGRAAVQDAPATDVDAELGGTEHEADRHQGNQVYDSAKVIRAEREQVVPADSVDLPSSAVEIDAGGPQAEPGEESSAAPTTEEVSASMQRANEAVRVLEERAAERPAAEMPEAGRDQAPEPERGG